MATGAYDTTVLALVQRFCGEYGLPVPSAIVGSTDSAVLQYKSILTSICRELATKNFQELKSRVTFNTLAQEDQGTIESLCGDNTGEIVQGSIWDETLRRPLFGPTGDQTWEMYKAFVNTGPLYQYQILGRNLLINPAPPAGHRIGLIVKSNAILLHSGAPSYDLQADTDTFRITDQIPYLGLEWRWKKIKGEPYEADQASYYAQISSTVTKMANLPTLHLDKSRQNLVPGIWVPAGNWPTT